VNGGRAVVKAFQFVRQCDIIIIWVVSEHDTLGRDVELSHRHFYLQYLEEIGQWKFFFKKKEKKKREGPRDAIVGGIPSSHSETPRSSRSLLHEALSSAEHHVGSGSGGCGVEERGVISSIRVFGLIYGD
jgi:hypothetical protein